MPNFTVASVAVQNGPREDDLIIYFYDSWESTYNALTTGDIDMMLFDLSASQVSSAFANPNIVTAKVPDSTTYQFDLNNNYSIMDYQGIRSPMNYTEMRQAVAWSTDKNYIVDTILGGFAKRIDQMIPAPFYGWANASMSYPNYPYEYDPSAAAVILDTKFPKNTSQTNPYYDAGFPGSSQYLRNYPDDHPQKAHKVLDGLKIKVRSDHSPRLQAGRLVYEALRKLGVPCDVQEGLGSVLYPLVMVDFNYHLYTSQWSGLRFPSPRLYNLYHSVNAFPGGSNYVTGGRFPFVGDNATDPRLYRTHPKLDTYLYAAAYPDSYTEAVANTKLAVGYMTEQCVNIPLWSPAGYWAWSKNLLGVVNAQGNDPENGYTFMNAYKQDGSAIRCGAINPPNAMNTIYSNWIYDYSNLDRMNLYSGIDFPAYNMALDMGGFTRDWETTTWDDNGTIKTKLVMTFRSDGYFVKPVSGDLGKNVNASHFFMSAWYHYQADGWWSSYLARAHHINITSSHTFEIYFDTYSYWNTYYAQIPLLPMDTWAQYDELVTLQTETFVNLTTPGIINLSADPIWIENVRFNGSPLAMFTDHNIVTGNLYVYSSLGAGTLEVEYWAVGSNPEGYYPGNLSWQTIFEGAGMYYCTSFTPGIGGSATYKRNPFYWMETPLLGEIDFARKQIGGRPIGPFKNDIFDLVLAAGAYGSQGTAVPSANWLPGADVAPPVGKVDIFDIVTIVYNYGQESDPPE